MRVRRLISWGVVIASSIVQEVSSVSSEPSSIAFMSPHLPKAPDEKTTGVQQADRNWFDNSVLNSPRTDAVDSNGNSEAVYSPGRAPAIPLAVRSPYVSAWSSTANGGSLNSQFPIFWDGSTLGWEGIVIVDDISYEWMGVGSRALPSLPNFLTATPITTSYDSSYSNFTFAAGPVELTASFFSPVNPQDLCRTSIPLSYLSVSVTSKDGGIHNVSLYTDVNGGWVTQPPAPLTWQIYADGDIFDTSNVTNASDALYTWVVQLQDQYVFGENYNQGQGVFPQWGNFTWSSSQGSAKAISFQSGYSINQRLNHVMGRPLTNIVDLAFRPYTDLEPVFAFQHDLGDITANSSSDPIVFTIGHITNPAIQFLSPVGIESLEPWWSSCHGNGVLDLVQFHYKDLDSAKQLANEFETKLTNDITKYYDSQISLLQTRDTHIPCPERPSDDTDSQDIFGADQDGEVYIFNPDNGYGYLNFSSNNTRPVLDGMPSPNTSEQHFYYAITAITARQILAAYVLTVPSSSTITNTLEPLAFQKEISSNGNVNTVDVLYPAIPFFLWINPDFLRRILTPLFMHQSPSHPLYPNLYAAHDIGSHFPNATGHPDGTEESMPVEESGNMILMTYAVYLFSGMTAEPTCLSGHYETLKRWARYLIDYSLIPASQLSTDDFAGTLANQSNLAIKGIVGLAAMSEIAALLNDIECADYYGQSAKTYYATWKTLAIDPTNTHTLLSYQWRSSWGLLYNVYPALLLNLSIIPDKLYEMQCGFYPSVSQVWGIPLDSRHSYTKSDWGMWVAATCGAGVSGSGSGTRELMVDALAEWLNNTETGRPFSDLFETVGRGGTPGIEFFGRPVQGGLFSLLGVVARERLGRWG